MAWYLAPSLAVLRAEVDARWPNRDRTSDGTIGDAAHQNTTSDHNPNSRESVNALDLDRDGISVPAIIAAVQAHPSARYWIFDRQIASRSSGWVRRPYKGLNAHRAHIHVSIHQTRTAEQDRRPWGIREEIDMATLDELETLIKDKVANRVHAYELNAQQRHAELLARVEQAGPVELDYDALAAALLRRIAATPPAGGS